MTDKVTKSLERLSAKEKKWVRDILVSVKSGNFSGLNISRLKGHKDIFRARKGDIRVIYRQVAGDSFVLAIERRSEKTYRNF